LVSYIGYDEKLIYHRDDIPLNGLIDLEGKISRPFSLVYHDLYLDGYRLTKYDLDIISPFVFAIKNLRKFGTVHNLEIYEKMYVPDEFVKFEYGDKSDYIMDKLFHLEGSFYQSIQNTLENITPISDLEDVDQVVDWFYSFFSDYVPFHFMNADERRDLEAYHHIFSDDGRVLLNADDGIKHEGDISAMFYFNHDKMIEEYGPNPDKWPKLNKVFDEATLIPDDTIAINEHIYRQYGYYTDDPGYDKVYDFEEKFVPEEPLIPTEGKEPADDQGPSDIEHPHDDLSSKDQDVERYHQK
jgi:hypothetical protein